MELFDRIVTLGTILLILWLFVRNPGEFIREWIVRPFWGAETADRMAAHAQAVAPAPDARMPAHDARNAPAPDARMPAPDARMPAPDARMPAPDARMPAHDARNAPAHDARNAPAHDEHARIDCAARALAAGLSGEAAIIELLFDGVTRGGGARYVALRDAVRERAAAYGARMMERPRTITIGNKREIEL